MANAGILNLLQDNIFRSYYTIGGYSRENFCLVLFVFLDFMRNPNLTFSKRKNTLPDSGKAYCLLKRKVAKMLFLRNEYKKSVVFRPKYVIFASIYSFS
jgi:hypothetical protein